ncbi:hypothetical protein [Aeromicrobium sp. 9AM]|uniref:hypothetical protein n=1 Tax=Aeromicrobium sp. 9AM TaxID=2653126 RepID=UPI0012F33C68|nr:hypothetical protein [Aeromicrobium sp. 9AM]VXB44430.1 hypothetical protein AERO9AM_140002 [Aeromicrobium sp. 9AM]
MDVDTESVVTSWVATALVELGESGYAQIDIADLLDPSPELGAQTALSCLQLAVNTARRTVPQLGGILTIPLEYEDPPLDLTREIPDLSDVLTTPTIYAPGYEVPGIYLVQPWLLNSPSEGERYTYSLRSEQLPDGYVSYYEAGRSPREIEQGWEFARAVFVKTVAAH